MGKLIVVSNRLPVTVEKEKNSLLYRSSIGGLATGLGSFHESRESTWVGWPGISSERITGRQIEEIRSRLSSEFDSHPVFLSRQNLEGYYRGFCNKTLWPLFSSFTPYVVYDEDLWNHYREVNRIFSEELKEIAEPGDTIWVHDYHLMLLPRLLREDFSEGSIGFFLHIPFPPFEIFRLLPWRTEILDGLLGSDLVGFHTYSYVQHFLNSVRRLRGHEHSLGQITAGNRIVKADAFPMGIEVERFTNTLEDPETQKEIRGIRRKIGDRKIVLSSDRLDYTKGILRRLKAFDHFLHTNPEYVEKVTLILVAVPSRTRVEQYKLLKEQLDEQVGQVNGVHGTIGWVPVWYMYRTLPFHILVALYNIADVGLITPLRDGMNLMAKEFVATKTDKKGVLILSEMAGAANEMGEALIVNPYDEKEISEALKTALEMPEDEQKRRIGRMQTRLRRYDISRWANDFMDNLSETKEIQQKLEARRLTVEKRRRLIQDYRDSESRVLFLDYDGTLVPFAPTPEEARPSSELLALVGDLVSDPRNEVVIISGRTRETLEEWFRDLDLGFIAEHGAWIRERGGEWETVKPLEEDWKDEIQPILELFVDRTPGSDIEEKEYSLVWHYRGVEPELASVRSRELEDALLDLTTHLNLDVLDGNKVIEIKDVTLNKGNAASRWLEEKPWEFVLAVGDDVTDEDTFSVLPESAYSIKVGPGASRSRFNVDSYEDTRSLLRDLAEA